MKYATQVFGNYMCRDPPCIIINPQSPNSSKIIFNTPSYIMRALNANSYKLNAEQTIMFTKNSTQTLNGFTYLVIDHADATFKQKKLFPAFKIIGNSRIFYYLQTAKYHLGAKGLSLSYTAWNYEHKYKIGIRSPQLLRTVIKSKEFPLYVGKLNQKIRNESPQKILDARKYLNKQAKIYSDNQFQIRPIFQENPQIKKQQSQLKESITNFLCFFKRQTFKATQNQPKTQNNGYCSGMLIITYKNLQQIKAILQRGDCFNQINQNGLLNQLQQIHKIKTSPNINQRQQIESQGLINQAIHIVDDPILVQTNQFHLLFNKINQILLFKRTKFFGSDAKGYKISHLFYGYGIRMQNTSYAQLSEMFLKSNVFYTIMARCFNFFPNIFNIHSFYWKQKFRSFHFLQKILSTSIKNYTELNFYKPGFQLKAKDDQSSCSYLHLNGLNFAQNIENLEVQYKKLIQLMPYKIKSYDIKIKHPLPISDKFKSFDPKVIFLGTKSKSPSDLRNTSGILLQMKNYITAQESLIMLDCGNSTYDQFMMHYSPQILDSKLKALKVIFITHLHADHTLGILDLICKRNKLIAKSKIGDDIQDKLFLIFPSNMIGWVHYYCQFVQDLTKQCVILFSQELANEQITIYDKFYEQHQEKGVLYKKKSTRMTQKKYIFKGSNKKQSNLPQQQLTDNQIEQFFQTCSKKETDALYYEDIYNDQQASVIVEVLRKYMFKQKIIKNQFQDYLKRFQIKRFLPTKVFHCPLSYGIVIEHESGIKISYSGDCRPTQTFLKEAERSSLMIHEATFPSFCIDDAKVFAHSTFRQAVQAGIQSKSQKTCLTHFKSQNFNIQWSQNLTQKHFNSKFLNYYMKNAIIACDHLQFHLSEMDGVGQVSRLVGYLGQQYMKSTKFSSKSKLNTVQQDKKDE